MNVDATIEQKPASTLVFEAIGIKVPLTEVEATYSLTTKPTEKPEKCVSACIYRSSIYLYDYLPAFT